MWSSLPTHSKRVSDNSFATGDKRRVLQHRLNTIQRISITVINGYPRFSLSAIKDETSQDLFFSALDGVVKELQATS